ncbi:MAG: LysM peptidoglycan-binding domain-containing protein [Bdellovibrionaceae bacterium]|nr:LysM peptidoglycan-binding domain-containing protein [Pseudobdellovibrionaceae bacterium]
MLMPVKSEAQSPAPSSASLASAAASEALLPAETLAPTPYIPAGTPSHRHIEKQGDAWIYQVNARATTVYMVSRDLYGDVRHHGDIIRWNDLKPPYHLKVGQKLRIETAPKLSEEQGTDFMIVALQKIGSPVTAATLAKSTGRPNPLASTGPAAPLAENTLTAPAPEAEKPHSLYQWKLMAGMVSMSLSGKDRANASQSKLTSKPSPQVSASVTRHFDGLGAFGVDVGLTNLALQPPAEGNAHAFSEESFNLNRGALIFHRQNEGGSGWHLALGAQQRVHIHGHHGSFDLELGSMTLPYAEAEYSFSPWAWGNHRLSPFVAAEVLAPAKTEGEKLAAGGGGRLGLNWSWGSFLTNVAYGYSSQLGERVEMKEQLLSLNAGWSWGGSH